MLKDIADFSIPYLLKKGADYVEARFETIDTSSFMLKNGVCDATEFQKGQGIGVRFLVKNTLGFISLNINQKEEVKKLLDRSFSLTERSSKRSDNSGLAPQKAVKSNYETKPKTPFKDVTVKEKMQCLLELEDVVKPITKGRYFSLTDSTTKKYYTNSEGSRIESKIPRLNLFYLITIQQNNQT